MPQSCRGRRLATASQCITEKHSHEHSFTWETNAPYVRAMLTCACQLWQRRQQHIKPCAIKTLRRQCMRCFKTERQHRASFFQPANLCLMTQLVSSFYSLACFKPTSTQLPCPGGPKAHGKLLWTKCKELTTSMWGHMSHNRIR